MRNRYSLGSMPRLYLDIIAAGVGVISQTPTIAIKRLADGKWFQVSDGSWQNTIVKNLMTQTDSVNMRGRYHFDFDQSLDTIPGSGDYIAIKQNESGTLAQEFEDLAFGPMPATTSPELCSVQGAIYNAQGVPVRGAVVRATLQPVLKDGIGRVIDSTSIVTGYTNETGDFDLPLVRGGTFRLEVPIVGYDRKVTIPDEPVVLFTDL